MSVALPYFRIAYWYTHVEQRLNSKPHFDAIYSGCDDRRSVKGRLTHRLQESYVRMKGEGENVNHLAKEPYDTPKLNWSKRSNKAPRLRKHDKKAKLRLHHANLNPLDKIRPTWYC